MYIDTSAYVNDPDVFGDVQPSDLHWELLSHEEAARVKKRRRQNRPTPPANVFQLPRSKIVQYMRQAARRAAALRLETKCAHDMPASDMDMCHLTVMPTWRLVEPIRMDLERWEFMGECIEYSLLARQGFIPNEGAHPVCNSRVIAGGNETVPRHVWVPECILESAGPAWTTTKDAQNVSTCQINMETKMGLVAVKYLISGSIGEANIDKRYIGHADGAECARTAVRLGMPGMLKACFKNAKIEGENRACVALSLSTHAYAFNQISAAVSSLAKMDPPLTEAEFVGCPIVQKMLVGLHRHALGAIIIALKKGAGRMLLQMWESVN
jgi:hypothetical protein